MTDFLLELLCEEIPARMQEKASADLVRLLEAELAKAGLKAKDIEGFVTPRRLALIARGLPEATEAVSEELKGPRADAPEQALAGFLGKTGLTRDQLVEREDAKGNKVLFAVIDKPGRPTPDVLAEAVPAIIRAFPWPKSMRWGKASSSSESLRWVRPLQGIVALFGDAVVPTAIDGIESGRETVGHRFHSTGPIAIPTADAYEATLHAAHVIVDHRERRVIVREEAEEAAAIAGFTLVEDEGLVHENAGLTEWPVPLLGRFDPEFLSVPREVIQLTMRTNQKYFACVDGEGKLAPAFVCTANIVAADGGKAIVEGNAKVLAARLSDARFFWEQDKKIALAEQAKKLDQIVFHEKLGTVADKVERVAKLARWLVEEGIVSSRHPGESRDPELHASSSAALDPGVRRGDEEGRKALADMAEQAARLAKADLVTGMVGEFPELQGVMGGYYARAEGLPDAVADAIRDHYKPVGQGDDVPTAPVTVAVSLADKLDTLVGFFLIDQRPTGSRDPFALRRACIGVIELLTKNGLRVWLVNAIQKSVSAFTRQICHPDLGEEKLAEHKAGIDLVFSQLPDFFTDRLKVQQRDLGVRHDLIDAVVDAEDDLVRLLARVKALQAFVETDDGANLLAGYRRAANILKAEAKKGTEPKAFTGFSYEPDAAEAELAQMLDTQLPVAEEAIAREQFEEAMTALSVIRPTIDRFFDDVTVNSQDETKRETRLALLDKLRAAMQKVADFSKIEG
ncbi:glycine--tRNA ligase subunit beta [Sphingomonas oligoaromativorans]|uniref:glycine--tRNA ligase subunit beta n=1 Tax=Sphingomonas oligoaromativorans TaxID=575322 RepID=UPI0014235C4F|nr:glycine--tRNA ligase subunit beta [Sphingomonas oligoaromativorans]NIJ31710.1 glycyl-tRNA synthetase beta chain [Sphingomonas oligoaromativorans]